MEGDAQKRLVAELAARRRRATRLSSRDLPSFKSSVRALFLSTPIGRLIFHANVGKVDAKRNNKYTVN